MLQVGYFDEVPKGKERKQAADIVTILVSNQTKIPSL